MRRVKLGLIGAGNIMRDRHVPALQKLRDHFEIVGICSRTERSAQALAERVGRPPVYTDYRQLLERADVEAVDIAVPIYLNYEISRAAAQAGKHILCEKPIGANLDEAAAMMKLPKEYGIVLLIAENFRYAPDLSQARAWVQAGAIGQPFLVHWQVVRRFDMGNPSIQTLWRQKPAHMGGFISDAGVHFVDALRTIIGEVELVQAFMSHIRPLLGTYDTAVINLRLAGGVLADFTMTWAATEEAGGGIEIFGTDGTIISRQGELILSQAGRPLERYQDPGTGGFLEEFRDFYLAIVQGKPPEMTLEEAYRDLAVILAAIRSAETGRVVGFREFLTEHGALE